MVDNHREVLPAPAVTAAAMKRASRRRRTSIALSLIALFVFSLPAAAQLPTGGEITAGSGSMGEHGNTLTVRQRSNRMIVNWQQFDVGAGNTVSFVQPNRSSIALNRVVSSNGSEILGNVTANGQIFLINPHGVLFGTGAQVDVGGLVASTLDLSDADFLAGKRSFTGSGGSVVNQGMLRSDGGYVALLGQRVSNDGVITARRGTVALGAGSAVTLDFAGDRLLNLTVDQRAFDALAHNSQLIEADGGTVILSARATNALLETVVNNDGIIEARTLEAKNGVIKLLGDMGQGTVKVDGVLDASAPDGGDGGFIETSGAFVKVADTARITTAAPKGATGQWLVDPNDFTVAPSGGDITGTTLSTLLENTNVTLQSIDGANVAGNGDIFVDDSVSWSAATTLTLLAERNIDINQAITAGSGNLVLRTDSGATGIGTVNFGVGGSISLASGRADLYYNPSSYATPTDYSGDISGTYTAWMLVNDVTQLQAINTHLAGNYALGADIDASATSGWNSGAGFVPLGNGGTPFSGYFDGLGHAIFNLHINRPGTTFVGLFGNANASVVIRNVGIAGGNIIGRHRTGALVGTMGGSISNSYATATVSGDIWTGGLVGLLDKGSVSNAYASGNVTGSQMVGGLIGWSDGTLSNTYASGLVTNSTGYVGGLIGYHPSGIVTNSFWNIDSSGQMQGTGNSTSTTGLIGLTGAQMMEASNFTAWSSDIWRIYDGYAAPLLKRFLTPVTVTVNSDSKTFDAAGYTGTPGVVFSDPAVASSLSGTLGYASSGVNVGSHALAAAGLYSGQQGYDITFVDGTLTITPAAITVSASDVVKTYDGTAGATGLLLLTGGTLFGSDSLSGGTFAFGDRNAGTHKTVTVGGVSVNDGNGGNNYAITYVDNTNSTIHRAALTISSSDVIKTYDGTTTAAGTAQLAGGTLFGSDSLSGGTFVFTDRNSGMNKTVTVGAVAVNDGNGGNNYAITYFANSNSTIDRAPLTIIADDRQMKAGDAVPPLTFTAEGLVAGDSDSLISGLRTTATSRSGFGRYEIDAGAATAGSNYYVAATVDGTLTITVPDAKGPRYVDAIGIAQRGVDEPPDPLEGGEQFAGLSLDIEAGGLKLPSGIVPACHAFDTERRNTNCRHDSSAE